MPKTQSHHEFICTAGNCTLPVTPECPAPLCTHHAQQVFAWVINTNANVSDGNPESQEPEPVQLKHNDRPGWVYFIRVDGLIKIGWSSYPRQRFKQLRPTEVLHWLPGTMEDEQQLHRGFRHLRAKGREYYRPDKELLHFIDQLRAQVA